MGYILNRASLQTLNDRVRDNVEQAGRDLALYINNAIQIPGPPRSQPGRPPHIDRHWLHGSYDIAMERGQPLVHVGTEVPYAPFLEQGTTAGLAARPHIVPTLIAMAGPLAYRIGTP